MHDSTISLTRVPDLLDGDRLFLPVSPLVGVVGEDCDGYTRLFTEEGIYFFDAKDLSRGPTKIYFGDDGYESLPTCVGKWELSMGHDTE